MEAVPSVTRKDYYCVKGSTSSHRRPGHWIIVRSDRDTIKYLILNLIVNIALSVKIKSSEQKCSQRVLFKQLMIVEPFPYHVQNMSHSNIKSPTRMKNVNFVLPRSANHNTKHSLFNKFTFLFRVNTKQKLVSLTFIISFKRAIKLFQLILTYHNE